LIARSKTSRRFAHAKRVNFRSFHPGNRPIQRYLPDLSAPSSRSTALIASVAYSQQGFRKPFLSTGRMTAAAQSGPANAPRPASSSPAIACSRF
jgi:hypothetical protein